MNFHAVSLQFRMYWKTKYFRFHSFGFLDILHKLYTCIRPWGDAFWLCDFENVLSWWSNRDSRDTCNLSLSPLPQTWALWEDFGASMLPELCPFTSEVLNLGFFVWEFFLDLLWGAVSNCCLCLTRPESYIRNLLKMLWYLPWFLQFFCTNITGEPVSKMKLFIVNVKQIPPIGGIFAAGTRILFYLFIY